MELRSATAAETARVRAGGIEAYLRWNVRRLTQKDADPGVVALDHAWLGERDAAAALLAKAREQGGSWVLAFRAVEPAWERLRTRALLVILRGGSWERLQREVASHPHGALARLQRRPLPTLDGAVTAAAMGTLVTGAWPERHGLVGNVFRPGFLGDEQSAFEAPLLAEPIWEAVERQGRRAAVVNVRLPGYRHPGVQASLVPSLRVPAPDLAALLEARLGDADFVRQATASAAERRDAVRRLLADSGWDVAIVDENVLDALGHPFGVASPHTATAWRLADAFLDDVLRALPADTSLVVASPYGMGDVHAAVPLGARIADKGLGASARVAAYGPLAHVYLAPGADASAVERALSGPGVARVVPRAAGTGRLFHAGRGGDLVVHAASGYVLVADAAPARPRFPADHGHAGDVGFLAWKVAGGTLEATTLVDVAPTVLALAGLDPPQHAQGRSTRTSTPEVR
jgi:hypothetical protein